MDLSSSPHLLFLLKKFYRFSRIQAPDGRQHPYGSGHVAPSEHQSLSTPLQDSLRFFRHLSLYLHQLALRLACLSGRRHRVTTFHTFDSRCLRPVLSAGGSFARVGDSQRSPTYPLTILVQAYQFLWLVQYDGSYKRSHMLAIASYPSTSPGGNFQEGFFLTVETPYRSTLAH